MKTTKITAKVPTQLAVIIKNLAEQSGKSIPEFAGDAIAYGIQMAIEKTKQEKSDDIQQGE